MIEKRVLLGTMIACALCVANPNACKNPMWYTKFCLLLQELHPDNMRRASSSQGTDHVTLLSTKQPADSVPVQLRATIAMLAPAVHVMHHVWRGMAWVAEDISDEDERVTSSKAVRFVTHPYF
ncbi:unnamed protein product [Gongylonema pulchrum]|uniref:Secreted protein n=1 Tax=Gongylonema pulchrum TaxID=637853 RepID=A0A183ENK3_9BILA|nr:unnamed protein product [Gongylonema pulchrum]